MKGDVNAFLVVERMSFERGLKASDVRGPRRHLELVRARRAICARLREEGCSYPEIGRALGGRHHTTIMYLLMALKKQQAWKHMVHLSGRLGYGSCGVVPGDGERTKDRGDVTCPTCVEKGS